MTLREWAKETEKTHKKYHWWNTKGPGMGISELATITTLFQPTILEKEIIILRGCATLKNGMWFCPLEKKPLNSF